MRSLLPNWGRLPFPRSQLASTYMLACQADTYAARLARFAIAAVAAADEIIVNPEDQDSGSVKIRVGICAGPVLL
jgi:hypothetical protein